MQSHIFNKHPSEGFVIPFLLTNSLSNPEMKFFRFGHKIDITNVYFSGNMTIYGNNVYTGKIVVDIPDGKYLLSVSVYDGKEKLTEQIEFTVKKDVIE